VRTKIHSILRARIVVIIGGGKIQAVIIKKTFEQNIVQIIEKITKKTSGRNSQNVLSQNISGGEQKSFDRSVFRAKKKTKFIK